MTYNIRLKQIWRRNYFYIPTIALYDLACSSLAVVIYSRKKEVQHKWQQHKNDSSHETELWDLSSVFAMVWLHWKDNLSPEHSNRDIPFSQKNRFMHLLSSWQKNSGVIVLIILIKENEMHGTFPMIQLSTCKFNWHSMVQTPTCIKCIFKIIWWNSHNKFRWPKKASSDLCQVCYLLYAHKYHLHISFFLLWRLFCMLLW